MAAAIWNIVKSPYLTEMSNNFVEIRYTGGHYGFEIKPGTKMENS